MSGASRSSRREFLRVVPRGVALSVGAALAWGHVVRTSRASPLTLRPPGALPDDDFAAACIRCGQCVAACPYDTLSLATAGPDVEPGTPSFTPRDVPCEMCRDVPCSRACPTGALDGDIRIEEARMGLAVLSDHENCLAWQGLRCEACYGACPIPDRAISVELRPNVRTGVHAYFIPTVHSETCTGCGKCERACVLPSPAIRVLPREYATGEAAASYRFGWMEEQPGVAPDAPPGTPDTVTAVPPGMDDLEGIVE